MRYLYTTLRYWAMLKKEYIIIKRDLLTYLFLIIIPFSEVILFGYIINTDAKHLPTVVLLNDHSPLTNSIIESFINTDYFSITRITNNPKEAEHLLNTGKAEFIVNIPLKFTHDLIRNQQPHILVEGDASNPVAVISAFNAAKGVETNALQRELQGPLAFLAAKNNHFTIDTHAKFNPAKIAQYHTLPGLLVAILTSALVMLTAISIASELENGTMEMLLITPIKPLEVILGKIIPHIFLGYILLFLTLLLSVYVFHVPFHGSVLLLSFAALPFLLSNLSIGLAASSITKSQFMAANIANTYILPAILFSGFMFPFYAMPIWAQWIGELLPPTHFLQITLDIMLKGAGFTEICNDLWPILLFVIATVYLNFKIYRNTLD